MADAAFADALVEPFDIRKPRRLRRGGSEFASAASRGGAQSHEVVVSAFIAR